MQQSDLKDVRLLARNGCFTFTSHAFQQMLDRGISYSDVENILISPSNQIIECQSPSSKRGMKHSDERVLLYDPNSAKDTIVVFVVLFAPSIELRIITVENVNYDIWERQRGIPCLVRK